MCPGCGPKFAEDMYSALERVLGWDYFDEVSHDAMKEGIAELLAKAGGRMDGDG